MRALSAHLAQASAAPTTEPWYLVAIGTVRLTDGPSTQWQGTTWQRVAGLEVFGLISTPTGFGAARLRVPSHNGLGTGLLLAAGGDDSPVAIYQVYGPGPHGADDAVLIAAGVLDGGVAEGEWAEFAVVPADADARELPRLIVAPPVFNSLPAPGTRIEWAGDVLVLEASR